MSRLSWAPLFRGAKRARRCSAGDHDFDDEGGVLDEPERTSGEIAQLVAAARAGDESAFRMLYESHYEAAYATAVHVLGTGPDAEDAVQDAFTTVFARLDRLQEPRAFSVWLLRAIRNRAIDIGRMSRETTIDIRDLPEETGAIGVGSGTDALAAISAAEAIDVIRSAMAVLGARDASALALAEADDLDGEALAEALEATSRGHAYAIVYRARARLRIAMGALLLVRHGRECDDLAALVEGVDGFSASLVQKVNAHIKECDSCERRRALLLDHPELAHAAEMPILPVPEVGERMWDTIAGTLPKGRAHRRLRRVVTIAAVVVALLAVLATVTVVAIPERTENDDIETDEPVRDASTSETTISAVPTTLTELTADSDTSDDAARRGTGTGQSANEQSVEEQSANEQAADEQSANEQPASEPPSCQIDCGMYFPPTTKPAAATP